MEGNPYAELLGLMRTTSEEGIVPSWMTAKLISLSPMKIEIAGRSVGRVLCNRRLLYEIEKDHEEQLRVGELVLVLQSADAQDFMILCKVVNG